MTGGPSFQCSLRAEHHHLKVYFGYISYIILNFTKLVNKTKFMHRQPHEGAEGRIQDKIAHFVS